MNIQALHNAIAAVCPIDGVAIARQSDKATWRIDFAAEATDQQKAAAQSVLSAFDITLLEDPKTFLARDLMALFTPSDYQAIMSSIATNAELGLLWSSLLAQGDAPISVMSERFLSGWAGLKQALGETRAGDISAALGIPNS